MSTDPKDYGRFIDLKDYGRFIDLGDTPPVLPTNPQNSGRTAAGDPQPCVTKIIGNAPDERVEVSLPITAEDIEGDALGLTDFLCAVNKAASSILPAHIGTARVRVAPRFREHEDDFGEYPWDLCLVYTRPLTKEEREELEIKRAASAAATRRRELDTIKRLCEKYGLHRKERP